MIRINFDDESLNFIIMVVFTKFNYFPPRHESFETCDKSDLLPADRVPSLLQIMQQFQRGNGDTSIVKDLPYNDIQGMPYLRKNLDLADLPDIASEVDATLEEVTEEIRQAKAAKSAKETDIVPTDGQPSE